MASSSKCYLKIFKIFLSKAEILALLFIYIFSHLSVSYMYVILHILYEADGQYILKNIWMIKMNDWINFLHMIFHSEILGYLTSYADIFLSFWSYFKFLFDILLTVLKHSSLDSHLLNS